jgi:hypothetical protein
MPDRHPPQIQYPVGGGRGIGGARGPHDPLRPDRPPADTLEPAGHEQGAAGDLVGGALDIIDPVAVGDGLIASEVEDA